MKLLEALAKICAILAGLVMVGITLLTCASVIGRSLLGSAINGDFELVGFAAGAGIALFLPWCQVKRGNIIVDFFTTGASEAARARMDRLGALLLAAVMALMSWRSVLGGLNAWTTQSGSMMLGFPEWVVYAFMVPPMTLTAVIALHQALFGFAQDDTEENPELAV
ncbi:MAG: TRAP transporter small permease [Betaproteobacteria bacterium]|nr:TRAP transporter small permease [Betaproteobacteria bacterium]NBS47993.1 TRAP transporter small permease [Betaproteobacteria bacterium]